MKSKHLSIAVNIFFKNSKCATFSYRDHKYFNFLYVNILIRCFSEKKINSKQFLEKKKTLTKIYKKCKISMSPITGLKRIFFKNLLSLYPLMYSF